MPDWLAILVTATFALIALVLTIRAWQVRSTTPRTVSLVLSSAACIAMLVAAVDLPLWIPPYLCKHPLEGDLVSELQRWSWHLRLCRRLQVKVDVDELAVPIDFPRIAAIANAADVAVDVVLPRTVPRTDDPLRLYYREKLLATSTPVPASLTSKVSLRFADAPAMPLECRIDRGPWKLGASIGELLEHRSDELDRGFHRLQCHGQGSGEISAVFTYVQIAMGQVLLVTGSEDIAEGTTTELTAVAGHGSFGLGQVTVVPEGRGGQIAVPRTAETTTMLVLDRPTHPTSCVRAREMLARGTSVVIAMPEPAFVAACPDLLPIEPGGDDKSKPAIFDRKPHLTYILDDFAQDLDHQPSCIYPDCEGKLGTPSPLKIVSRDIQIKAARKSCERLTAGIFPESPPCDTLSVTHSHATEDSDAVVRLLGDPRGGRGDAEDSERLAQSAPDRAVRPLVEAFAQQPSPIYRENEMIVVFTFDHRTQPDPWEILETGSRVQIVQVKDPYATSLQHIYKASISNTEPPDYHLVKDSTARLHGERSDCKEWRCADLPDELALVDDEVTTRATTTRLISRSRFLPEPSGEATEPTAAPTRFGWWEPIPGPRGLGAGRIAYTTTSSGLRERPLALGTMFERGHLLILTYSPFARVKPWKGAPKTHLEVLGGHRLIELLHDRTSSMRIGDAPAVRSVSLRPDGAVWITVIGATGKDGIAERLSFIAADGAAPIDAPLVDFDDTRGLLTYALPAHELSRLTTCREYGLTHANGNDPVVACPPADIARFAGTMHAVMLLRMLAHYTGGQVLDPADDLAEVSLSTRPFGLAALALILLVAWGRRAARRIGSTLAVRRLWNLEQAAQRRYDPPDAVVAAAGDWDGRSSTWPRTGAFGGYRPLEAGDRPSAIVLQDFVLAAQGWPQPLPRVAQRIEEAAPTILVLVNLGASMRVPGGETASKATFAGHVAMHVAATAWKIRAEVEIHAAGIAGESEIVAPTRLSPGHEELDSNLRACLAQAPEREATPWPEEPPECGSIVYISDFQLEDARAFQAWVTRLEAAGIRVGGVMVYSPVEFTMIEGGRLAGSGVWADRTDWDPDDVFAAFSRRRDAIEQVFDATTTGGLIVASTQFNADDVAIALESGRLLQLLR